MSVIKAFFVSPLKWLRVTVAVIFFLGIAYAFLHHIPAWNVPNMTGGGEGMEDSFSLAQWQFIPSVLGALDGVAVSAVILAALLLVTGLFGGGVWGIPVGIGTVLRMRTVLRFILAVRHI